MKKPTIYIVLIKRLILGIFGVDHTKLVTEFVKEVQKLWINNGFMYMISYMKVVRLHITRYVCGKPLYSNASNVSLDSSGFPTRFLFLKHLLDEGDTGIKIVFTLLSLTRGLKPTKAEDKKIKYDLSPITAPSKGTTMGSVPGWFIKEFVRRNDLRRKLPEYSVKDHYLSTKGGPSGKSTWASQWSHLFYKQDLILSLAYIFGDGFKELFYTPFLKNMHLSYGKDRWPNGKLSIVKDPEGKRRVIAMVDYHSQLALRKVHEDLLSMLNKFSTDRTFSQDPRHNWNYNNSELFYSLDLSSATDRFPVRLQARLVGEIYGNHRFGEQWANLLLNRDYMDPEGNNCRYAVGQPMGAYSSWAAFTLTHHLTVAWSAYKARKTMGFDQYIILGDDIVIKDNRIAEIYKGQMMRMGVDISLPKTHVSKNTYEFAKRWIKDDREITGIPLKGILNNINNLKVVFTILNDYLIKCPTSVPKSSWAIFQSIFLGFQIRGGSKGRKTRTITHKYLENLRDFAISVRYSMNLTTPYELRAYFASKVKLFKETSDYQSIPSEKLILPYMEGILTNGLAKISKDTIIQINKQLNSFDRLAKEDKRSLVYSGVLFGLMNRLERLQELCQRMKDEGSTVVEFINHFTAPSVDSLSRKDRDINIRMAFLDSLWKKSLQKHFSDQRFPDSYYRNLETRTLYGSLDALDIIDYEGEIEVRPIWSRELSQFNQRSINSLQMFISENS
jgi:hypothetical protein